MDALDEVPDDELGSPPSSATSILHPLLGASSSSSAASSYGWSQQQNGGGRYSTSNNCISAATTGTAPATSATTSAMNTATSSSNLLGGVYQSGDHVSCEDLLEFARDRPDSRRTSGPQHGENSDECKLIRKILKNQVRVVKSYHL